VFLQELAVECPVGESHGNKLLQACRCLQCLC
jgi:hypothetical protein